MSPAIVATVITLGLVVAYALLVGWVLMCAKIQSLWWSLIAAVSPAVLLLWVCVFAATGGFE